ncbi:MAG: LysR family transcriptional regulator, partial [Proteobacteria bacterium]|nr:LysR family transcriptional regulator [Pseudomonadota bacterium]
GHPLRLSDLLPYTGATLHQDFGLRQHIQAAELSEGVRLAFSFTTTSFDALGHFVLAGLGYSLVSRLPMTPADAAKVIALPMRNSLLRRGRSHVVTRQGRALSPAAAELLRIIIAGMKPSVRNTARPANRD